MATNREKLEALVEFSFREGFRHGIVSRIAPGEPYEEQEQDDWDCSESCAILEGRNEHNTLEDVYNAWRKRNVDSSN